MLPVGSLKLEVGGPCRRCEGPECLRRSAETVLISSPVRGARSTLYHRASNFIELVLFIHIYVYI